MSEKLHKEIVILGSGPAGLTAAIYAARADFKPLMINGPLPGGLLTTSTEIENYPGFEDPVLGSDLMAAMEKQARRFGTDILIDSVIKADLSTDAFSVQTQSGQVISCEVIIIATGATPRLLGLEEEKELMGYGVSTCATCDGAFFRDQIIAVVGGGDSACEEALFLSKFGSKVLLIHRRDELRASKIMQERVLNHDKIEVLWNKQVKGILGSKEDGVTGLTLFHSQTKKEENLSCGALFVAIGHIPNSQLFKGQLELDSEGYIVTKPNSTAASQPGVFACGDVQDNVFRQAITAAGSGCMAAIEAKHWLEQ